MQVERKSTLRARHLGWGELFFGNGQLLRRQILPGANPLAMSSTNLPSTLGSRLLPMYAPAAAPTIGKKKVNIAPVTPPTAAPVSVPLLHSFLTCTSPAAFLLITAE